MKGDASTGPRDGGVEVQKLRRTYQKRGGEPRHALDGVDLTVAAGEVHGLLGPNGAGKTTLCKVLCTLLTPTSGSARVNGFDVVDEAAAVRRVIGIVFGGDRGLYTRLTARENLTYWSALYLLKPREARDRVAQLLERVGLDDRADERVETYSRGMKQRLHLARDHGVEQRGAEGAECQRLDQWLEANLNRNAQGAHKREYSQQSSNAPAVTRIQIWNTVNRVKRAW